MRKVSNIKTFFILGFFTLGIYSSFIEPTWLEETFHNVKINKANRHIKIAHVSDLHSDKMGNIEKTLFKSLEKEAPDLIVITGDIATPGGEKDGYQRLLNSFKAPLGVFFVHGNWESWEPIPGLEELLKNSGIINLTNHSKRLTEDLWLYGFDDDLTGSPKEITEMSLKEASKIAIFHSPTFFNKIKGKVDLAFSGHSHGGQIRLPFLGAPWTPEGTGLFTSGWFEASGTKMYVSRGIGTSILPIRFNCRPEVAYIDLYY